jgi:F-type H+-transporting ATPase subunit b
MPSISRRRGALLASRRGALSRAIPVSVLWALGAKPALASSELVLFPDWPLLVILVVGFAVLIFPLNALLFQPIFSALDARAERIAGARERSSRLKNQADEILERYQSAIRQARSESESDRQAGLERAREQQNQLTDAARAEAERELERARLEMSQAVEEARAGLRASAEDIAQAAAEQVLGRPLA